METSMGGGISWEIIFEKPLELVVLLEILLDLPAESAALCCWAEEDAYRESTPMAFLLLVEELPEVEDDLRFASATALALLD
jgi:hypothetical protein